MIIIGFTFVTSCNKNESGTKTIKFSNTDSLSFYQYGYLGYKDITNKNLVIVRVQLWRKKRDCLHGLGICSIKFFPKEKSSLDNNAKGRTIDIPIKMENGEKYIILYYAQDVSRFTSKELKLTVDTNLPLGNLNIIAGGYQFRKDLGDYGGYLIPLSKK